VILHQAGTLRDPLVAVFGCPKCGRQVRTSVIDEGTVPDTLGCRATAGCDGVAARTGMGKPFPGQKRPGWEWYAPDAAAMLRLQATGGPTWDHVAAGGLLIRRTVR
jgi:hypothetical protein